MTGLERDFLHQLTRIADALEKQNKLQESAMDNFKDLPNEELPIGDDGEMDEADTEDLSNLLKKLSKFK
jgi:hypothetical protein